MKKLYADRDITEQGNYYADHIGAMTSEKLHSKSDIAAELAHRDIVIDDLLSLVRQLLAEVEYAGFADPEREIINKILIASAHEVMKKHGLMNKDY